MCQLRLGSKTCGNDFTSDQNNLGLKEGLPGDGEWNGGGQKEDHMLETNKENCTDIQGSMTSETKASP